MSSAGVASTSKQGTYLEEHNKDTMFDDEWTNKPGPTSIDHLDYNAGGELSADMSERELGVRYFDDDSRIDDEYVPAYQKRQQERREARRAEWRDRMGISNIKDENTKDDE